MLRLIIYLVALVCLTPSSNLNALQIVNILNSEDYCKDKKLKDPEELLKHRKLCEVSLFIYTQGKLKYGGTLEKLPFSVGKDGEFNKFLYSHSSIVRYSFYNKNVRSDSSQAINISAEDAWKLIDFGDVVHISDRITHHVVTVAEKDNEKKAIYFIDPWPEQFFLNQSGNEAQVSSTIIEIKGKKYNRITKDEFKRVFIGILKLGHKEFPKVFFNAFPEYKETLPPYLAWGLKFLDYEYPGFKDIAIKYLTKAAQLSKNIKDLEHHHFIISKLYLALNINYYRSLYFEKENRNFDIEIEKDSQYYFMRIKKIKTEFNSDDLLNRLDENELYKITTVANMAEKFSDANIYLNKLFSLNKDHPGGLMYMAKNAIRHGNIRGALLFSSKALAVVDKKIQEIEQELEIKGTLYTIPLYDNDSRYSHNILKDLRLKRNLGRKSVIVLSTLIREK